MHTALLFDLGTAAFLLLFVVLGASRGLFRTLTGFLSIVCAIVGAAWLAATFSPVVSTYLYPFAEGKLTAYLSLEGGGEALADFLASFGADEALVDALLQGFGGTADALLRTALESVLQVVVQGVLLLLAFLVLLLVLKLLSRIVGLVFRLPVLRSLDTLGGALFGLAEGAALLFLAVYAARSLGSSFFTDGAEGTYLLTLFVAHTPRTLLAAIFTK